MATLSAGAEFPCQVEMANSASAGKEDRPASAYHSMLAATHDAIFKQRASMLGEQIGAEQGVERAVALIEAHLARTN